MKRSELKRTKPMTRTAGLARGARIKAVNRKRRQSEQLRCYGPPERRAWVKTLGCLVCFTAPSDNAHVETDGAGRKAGYDRIVPLCRAHHRRYDEHQFPFHTPEARQLVKDAAPRIEALWLNHLTRSGRTAA